jgi:hypothetical protein
MKHDLNTWSGLGRALKGWIINPDLKGFPLMARTLATLFILLILWMIFLALFGKDAIVIQLL